MVVNTNEEKIKEIFKEALTEVLEERKDLLYEIIHEALEDIAMERAIREGRKNRFVESERILKLLE